MNRRGKSACDTVVLPPCVKVDKSSDQRGKLLTGTVAFTETIDSMTTSLAFVSSNRRVPMRNRRETTEPPENQGFPRACHQTQKRSGGHRLSVNDVFDVRCVQINATRSSFVTLAHHKSCGEGCGSGRGEISRVTCRNL